MPSRWVTSSPPCPIRSLIPSLRRRVRPRSTPTPRRRPRPRRAARGRVGRRRRSAPSPRRSPRSIRTCPRSPSPDRTGLEVQLTCRRHEALSKVKVGDRVDITWTERRFSCRSRTRRNSRLHCCRDNKTPRRRQRTRMPRSRAAPARSRAAWLIRGNVPFLDRGGAARPRSRALRAGYDSVDLSDHCRLRSACVEQLCQHDDGRGRAVAAYAGWYPIPRWPRGSTGFITRRA